MASVARPIRAVPVPVALLLAAGLCFQIIWHASRPPVDIKASALPWPPSAQALQLATLGDRWVASKLLMLWLQAFDNQPGISIPFSQLDYDKVEAWLDRILDLDPRARYPLVAASRVYAFVYQEPKKRQMLDFVYRRFLESPDERWPSLAHAAIVAKHQLDDLPLALKYARAITEKATGEDVPNWARDMSVVILEEMGELEAAQILIGGLLDSGRVTDPHEIRFLEQKLEELRAQISEPIAE